MGEYRCPHGTKLFDFCSECTAKEVAKVDELPDGYGEEMDTEEKSYEEQIDDRNFKTTSKPYDEFLQEILEKCAKVKTLAFPEEGGCPDYEAAHGLEDEVFHDVVVYISYGKARWIEAIKLASQAAGLLRNLDYPRWTA